MYKKLLNGGHSDDTELFLALFFYLIFINYLFDSALTLTDSERS